MGKPEDKLTKEEWLKHTCGECEYICFSVPPEETVAGRCRYPEGEWPTVRKDELACPRFRKRKDKRWP